MQERKKIVLVIPHLGRGGAERVMSLLYQSMRKTHEVHLVIYHGPVEYEVEGKVINLELPSPEGKLAKALNVFRRTRALKRVFRRIQPDLIISFIGNLQPILTGWPVVVSIRIDLDYSDEFSNARMHDLLFRTVYRLPNVKHIVAVSHGIERKLARRYGFGNLSTQHNPIDFELVDRMVKAPRPLEEDYLLAVGSFKRQNAFDFLIKAYAKSGFKDRLKLVLVGDGHLRPDLEALITSLGLEDRVLLAGKQTNPFVFMKYATFFVLASRYEGFPNVLIEAMACGCACVSTDCETGPNEIIEPGKNGILVPVEDEAALVSAMERLEGDLALRQKFQAAARPSVSHLAVDQVAARWLSFLDED